MSLKEKALKLIEQAKLGEKTNKAVHMLGAPQRYVSEKAASFAGLKPEAQSDQNFANIADKAGDLLGVPRDSAAGNVVKALAVGGAELAADPLGFLPVGKIAKGVKGLKAMASGASKAATAADLGAALQKLQKVDNIGQGAKMAKESDKIIQPILPIEKTKTGKELLASKAENEFKAAPAKLQQENILDMNNKLNAGKLAKAKEEAKKFAIKSVQEELKKQPALKRDANYIRERISSLTNFFFKQNKNK